MKKKVFLALTALSLFANLQSAFALRVYSNGACSGSGGNCLDTVKVTAPKPRENQKIDSEQPKKAVR